MSGRSPEEREAARLERERKRAAREGRPFTEPAPEPPVSPPAPEVRRSVSERETQIDAPHDPQATQQWDAATEWTGEHAAVELPAGAEDPPAEAPSTPAHAEPADPPSTHADAQPTEQYDVAADWTSERAAVTTARVEADAVGPAAAPADADVVSHVGAPGDAAALTDETPLGTRRVAPHEHPRLAARATGRRGRAGVPPTARRDRAAAPPAGGGGAARPPVAPRPARRGPRRILAVLALALIVIAGWFLVSLYQPFAGEGEGRVAVRIPAGAGVSEVGDILVAKGVVSSAFFFRLRASLSGDTSKLKAGRFTLKRDMSYAAALEALMKNPPPPPVVRITLPEGPSRGELAPRVKQAGLAGSYTAASRTSKLLSPRQYGAPKGTTLEGFLFPATYELKRGATAKDLVAAQVRAFKQNLDSIDLRYARSKNLTVFDLVTIASMVEREVAVAKERPLVAAVIYNRLHDGIPLGIDATLRFGLGNWTRPLKVSELASDTPYNTRKFQGLPPGPIGNPGLASLQASAHPAKVDYLFYVVKPGTCGEHAFSSTDAEFQQDVARYNQARDAAGGKSPTKC